MKTVQPEKRCGTSPVRTWTRCAGWLPPPPREKSGPWRNRRRLRKAPPVGCVGSSQPGGGGAPAAPEESWAGSAARAARSPPPPSRWGPLAPWARSSTLGCCRGWSSRRTHCGREVHVHVWISAYMTKVDPKISIGSNSLLKPISPLSLIFFDFYVSILNLSEFLNGLSHWTVFN